MRFDGKAFAGEIEKKVAYKVRNLAKKPRIVSVLVGDEPASELYTKLKKEMAERVGIDFEIERVRGGSLAELEEKVRELGGDKRVDGLMIQMPIPRLTRKEQEQVVKAIPVEKDIDGLRWEESGVMPATVRAILSILGEVGGENWQNRRIVILGTHGSVGRPLVKALVKSKVGKIVEINSETTNVVEKVHGGEIVISCVGRAGLIQEDMISNSSIVIDVGISNVNGKVVGDMTQGVYDKARVAVGVPGGVGPVTIASLMENVVNKVL